MLPQRPALPVGARAEDLVAAVPDARRLDERVAVADVDECRAGAVRRLRERDRELAVLRVRVHEERVALAEAQAAQHECIRVALALRTREHRRHREYDTRFRAAFSDPGRAGARRRRSS
jgi:hypothetical protein